uniref:Uncharacterized protein n=1 Tax=Ditylenchus dipsaci TaxID=166011 RepID=A0A915DNW4_9BILA
MLELKYSSAEKDQNNIACCYAEMYMTTEYDLSLPTFRFPRGPEFILLNAAFCKMAGGTAGGVAGMPSIIAEIAAGAAEIAAGAAEIAAGAAGMPARAAEIAAGAAGMPFRAAERARKDVEMAATAAAEQITSRVAQMHM